MKIRQLFLSWGLAVALLDEVKQRLDIVEVVSHYVPLEQAGRNFKARCPFHTERTPSFFVFPERQTWRCFGACASGGDALGFVMRAEGLGFGDALRLLAQRLGVKAPQGATATRENPLYEVNGQAASFYHQYLLTGPDADHARRFLEQRGVTENSLREFRLGLSPAGWDVLKKHLLSRGFSEALMLQAGLIHRAEDGRTRDLFRGRLMFPICEPQEKVAGFGGRSLDGSEPKYLNSPKTPIFDKGRLLYGLPLASDAIRLAAEAIVVEGYIDVVIAHQEGFRNVVASMGTALTDQQVGLLRGSAPSCVLALDPDTAGQEATFHSLEASWKVFSRPSHGYGTPGGTTVYERPSSVALKIAALPPGKDPDDLIRESRTLWETVIKGSTPLLEFLFFTLPTRYDLSTPQGKLQLAERLGALVIMVESSGEQDHYLQRLEQLLGISRRDLSEVLGLARQRLLQRGKRPQPPKVEMAVTPFIQTLGDPLESYTLTLLLQHPWLKELVDPSLADRFHSAEHRELFTKWIICSTLESLRATVDEGLRHSLDLLTTKTIPPLDSAACREALSDCLSRLEEREIRAKKAEEELWFEQQGDDVTPAEETLSLNRRLREVFLEKSKKSES